MTLYGLLNIRIVKNGSLNGASYAAVWSIFSTRVHALTQPPNQPTTFVDGAKINVHCFKSRNILDKIKMRGLSPRC